MKRILFSLTFILITSFVFGQDKLLGILPLKDGNVNYSGVVQVDSISKDTTKKDELYKRAKRWFIDTYNSAKDVIQLDDKENGEIIAKGFFEVSRQVGFLLTTQTFNIWQTFKIQVKDGRYKYEITDFRIKSITGEMDQPLEKWMSGSEVEYNKKYCVLIDTHVKELITSLEKFMNTKPKDDW